MAKIIKELLSKEITDKYTLTNNALKMVAKDNPKDLVEAIIGDDKQPDTFYPQVKLQRWDNECNLSVRLVDDEKNPVVSTDKEKITWTGAKRDIHFYDLPISEEHPEGGYEFEIILKEKPETNVVEFTLNDKDVEYFYQPPLVPVEDETTPEGLIKKVLLKKPTSVLDIGGNDGWLTADLLVRGINSSCVDKSLDGYTNRKTDNYIQADITKPWDIGNKEYDLISCFGVTPYIPKDKIDFVISEIVRTSNRAVISPFVFVTCPEDITEINNGYDKSWLENRFHELYPEYPVQVLTEKTNFRPDNVVGSYVIYAKTPKINYEGGKEYKTGQVGFIYRPKIIDSVGTEIWGELNIADGILSVTIPQDYLDKAVYPIRHAAGLTFGYTTKAATSSTTAYRRDKFSLWNETRFGDIYSPASSGTVSKISVLLSSSAALDVKAFLNQVDSGGSGNHGQITTAEVANTTFSNANFTDFTCTGAVTASTNYILSMLGNASELADLGYIYAYFNTVASRNAYLETYNSPSFNYSSPESPWLVAAAGSTQQYSIYATYTASGGSTPTVKGMLGMGIIPSPR